MMNNGKKRQEQNKKGGKAGGLFSGSVFIKLLAIFIISGTIMVILMSGFLVHAFRKFEKITLQKNLCHYLSFVVKETGDPPSLERALEIRKKTALQTRFEGPDSYWTTSDKIPLARDLTNLKVWQESPLIKGKILYGVISVVISDNLGTFVFVLAPEHRMPLEWGQGFIVILAIITATGVFLTYIAIRLTLSPLRILSDGINRIGDGDLGHVIPENGSIEFIRLAGALNTMSERIRRMLHSREQLLLDVSHELRSPLTRMNLILEFLPDDRERHSLKAEITEMKTMITEILETARFRNGATEPRLEEIDVSDLLTEISAAYTSKPGLKTVDISEGASIYGDLMLVKMALNNVISNAIKYSGQDGKPVEIFFDQIQDYSVLKIQDYGIGIPFEDQPHIFEPFYRVDKSRSKKTGGYGLGLSLCKTAMEAHGGKIEIESAPGIGTSVSLFFPKKVNI